MKEKNKMQMIVWGLSLLPLVIVAVCYGRLPEQIPTNWGFNGRVAYGSKSTLWVIAGMSLLLGMAFYGLPAIDPKRDSYKKFRSPYLFFQIMFQLFMLAVISIVLIESFRPGTVNVTTIICALCGVFFMVIGNVLPKFRQNFFCGFKTPWTLSNEVVWTKTNRLGGRMMFGAGFLGLIGAFLPSDVWKMVFLLAPLTVASVVPLIMSYVWFERLTKRE